jgi:ketosteroid isomerase-like protein
MTRAPAYDRNAALARTFVDAFNRRDLDDFLGTLADDVEVRTARGVRRGRTEVAAWFAKPFDHLDLHLGEGTYVVAEDRVVGIGELVFTWKETGEEAERLERSVVWRVEDGRIRSWEPFETRADALRAAGILTEAD